MSGRGPVLVLFHGGAGSGAAERMVAGARAAAARLGAGRALQAGFAHVIIATDDPRSIDDGRPGVELLPDPAGEPFAFDQRLGAIVAECGLDRPVVMGAGALPLLMEADFAAIAAAISGDEPSCVTNNLYSADVTGWYPGDALRLTGHYERDNALPRLLRDRAGLPVTSLPRTTATQFDLDTPTDLALLGLQAELPGDLVEAVRPAEPIARRAVAILPSLCNREAEILVAGRVGSQTWHYLERETACRVRVYSEERGLATSPPGYVARSALGYLLERTGPVEFFALLGRLGDAALVDTRVLMAHAGLDASREDRFQSDLFAADKIEDGWLQALTAAAAATSVPLLLGGHSLVSGGLMALNDAAWTAHDAGEGVRQPGIGRH